MGTRKVEQGEVGHRVAAEIRRIREEKHLSLQVVSDRLTALGRPILPSGLSKIEQGTRRVDVDDLVALADALETAPSRLLRSLTLNRALIGVENEDILQAAIDAVRAAEKVGISRDEVVEWLDFGDRLREMTREMARISFGSISDETRAKFATLTANLQGFENKDE